MTIFDDPRPTAHFYCGSHACGECAGCKEAAFLGDLVSAEQANPHADECKMCTALAQMSDQVKLATERALAGTIGRDKLVTILANNGYPVGRRAVERHRQEGHTS